MSRRAGATTAFGISISLLALALPSTSRAQDRGDDTTVGPRVLSHRSILAAELRAMNRAELSLLDERLTNEMRALQGSWDGPQFWGPAAFFMTTGALVLTGTTLIATGLESPIDQIYTGIGFLVGAAVTLVVGASWAIERTVARNDDPVQRRLGDLGRARSVVRRCRRRSSRCPRPSTDGR